MNEGSVGGYLNEPEWMMTMRGTSIRWLMAAAMMVWAGACRCPPPSSDNCDDVVVAFVSPMDGDTVAATLDATIKVTDSAGNAVDIDSATLATRLVTGGDFAPAHDGTVSGSQATFSGITLDSGMSLLKATYSEERQHVHGVEDDHRDGSDGRHGPAVGRDVHVPRRHEQ